MRSEELIERLLDQNDRMLNALIASSPVEVIRALNPPVPQSAPEGLEAPWAGDRAPDTPDDPWGDEGVPLELLRSGPPASWRGGWVEGPKPAEETTTSSTTASEAAAG